MMKTSKRPPESMKKTCFMIFFLMSLALVSRAQEEPYYELPTHRKTRHEIMNMPNLDAKVIKWYISASAGMRPVGSVLENDLDGIMVRRKLINTFWDVNLGYNMNYNLFYEVGLMQNPVFVSSYFSERISRSIPLVFKEGKNYYSIPLRIKKRVVMLDKLTRMAWVNAGLGIVVSPGMRSEKLNGYDINLLRRVNGAIADTVVFRFNSHQQSVPVNFEIMAELGGKVVEQLEISVFAKAMIFPKPVVKSDFSLIYEPDDIRSAAQKSNPVMLQFGLNIKFNYPAVIRYDSRL